MYMFLFACAILQECATVHLGINSSLNPPILQATSDIGGHQQQGSGHQQQGSGILPGELPIAIAVQPEPGVTVGSFPVALHAVIGGVGMASAPPQAPAVGTAASAPLTDMNAHVPNLAANKLGSEPGNMCSSMADNMGDAAVSNLVAGDALPAASAAMALPAQAGVLAPGRALEHDKDLGLDVSSSIAVSSQLAPPTLSDMCAAPPVGAESAHDVMVAAATEGEGAGGDEEADIHGGGAAGLGAEDGGMDAGVVGVEAEVHVVNAEPDAADAAVIDADAAAEHAAAEQAEVEHHAAEHAAAEQAAVDAGHQDADVHDEASPDEDVQTVGELQEAGEQAEAVAAEDVGDVAAVGGDEDETMPQCEVNEDATEVGQHVPCHMSVADEGCGDTSMPASLEERVADDCEGVVSADVVAMEEEAGGHEGEEAGSCEAVDEAGAAVSQSFQEEEAEVAQHVNEHSGATDDSEMGPPEL